ncbi:hypothetical protein EYF80_054721 [Liparis tanakae]|uniref:Uncharacterized protein n=1 Tax=Liparis tanakae TaxID=230148 RepID=A0A4Z2F1N4_9TELE|nr:hypothetical protein EYF80_054721 [Liparis tanakae]
MCCPTVTEAPVTEAPVIRGVGLPRAPRPNATERFLNRQPRIVKIGDDIMNSEKTRQGAKNGRGPLKNNGLQ